MTHFTDTPQWKEGQAVENFLDAFFRARGWQIERTTPHEERVLCLGDRHFSYGGHHHTVEYKSGVQTAQTGNIFLETISVDSQNKPGWVYTCRADYLHYAILPLGKILVFVPARLRIEIEDLKERFRTAMTSKGQNKGYNTHGVLVPLAYAEEHLVEQIIRW